MYGPGRATGSSRCLSARRVRYGLSSALRHQIPGRTFAGHGTEGWENMNELKKCPFCSSNAKFEQTNYGETDFSSVKLEFRISCSKCGATTPGAFGNVSINLGSRGDLNCWRDDREQAIAAWNRRAGEDG